METRHDPFKTFIECYVDLSYLFMQALLPGSAPLHRHETVITPQTIPGHLQAEYRLLHLPAGANLAEMRTQYRELAKCYHPDAGGDHANFLALQQAYERVVEYLQTHDS